MSGTITVSSTTDSQEAVDQAAEYGEQTLPFPEEEKPGQSEVEETPETGTVADSEPAEIETEEEEEPEEEEPEPAEAAQAPMGQTRRGLAAQVRRQAAEISELRELVKKLSPQEPQPPKPDHSKRPDENDPKYRGKGLVDVAEDVFDYKLAKQEADKQKQEQEQIQAQHKEVAEEVKRDYWELLNAAKEKYADFYEVVHPVETTLPTWLQDFIVPLPNAPEVSYYLGKHPKEVEQLMAWNEQGIRNAGISRMVARVQNISDHLGEDSTPPASSSSSSPQPRPAVPRPLRHVGGASTATTPLANPDKMSMKDYNTWRDSGGGR